MTALNVTDLNALSFPEAIAFTQTWLEQVESQKLTDTEILAQMQALLSHRDGVRGFFVSYLTGNSPLADQPPGIFLDGFTQVAEHIYEILVKNVAMSTAMAIAHRRNGDFNQQQGSERVKTRSLNLLKQLEQRNVIFRNERLRLLQTLEAGSGDYQDFLARWQYDPEQCEAIRRSLQRI
ncbi:hypothetical protein FEK30_16315 (plasmid) [Picosynechococcus sp. PCC 11901]|uniref:hypothetical protein n=1 Tax=Picosynechococcus sp. PCC 11901 TaxID=2579791 RepID=UPI0010FBC734|nr:hypothetical protein [Picosynechococcus sp. PCC 11901]QCS51076.1 hypothetical protein FEK30_16315 [Picosynechococcus sp. PCC 11901]